MVLHATCPAPEVRSAHGGGDGYVGSDRLHPSTVMVVKTDECAKGALPDTVQETSYSQQHHRNTDYGWTGHASVALQLSVSTST